MLRETINAILIVVKKMECILCRKEIEFGEKIYWISPVEFSGPEDFDIMHLEPSDDFRPALHQVCLESPAAATRVADVDTSGDVVKRSDALGLFGE